MKYNILHFPEKGEILIKYETKQEFILTVIHNNESNILKNSLSFGVKPFHFMVYYKNKFDGNNVGTWICNDYGTIEHPFFDSKAKRPVFNTLTDFTVFQKSKFELVENYDYIRINCSRKGHQRSFFLEFNDDFESRMTIVDTNKKEFPIDFFVDSSYPHINWNEDPKNTDIVIQRGYNKKHTFKTNKLITNINFKPTAT